MFGWACSSYRSRIFRNGESAGTEYPNDAYLITLGKRGVDREIFMLQYIRDNREHPDQQHLRIIYRTPIQQDHRLTIAYC